MVLLVDFVAPGFGHGVAAGAQCQVLFGLGAMVGPPIAERVGKPDLLCNSPRDVLRGQPVEARVPQVLKAQGAMGGSRPAGPVPPVYEAGRLMDTLKGTGG